MGCFLLPPLHDNLFAGWRTLGSAGFLDEPNILAIVPPLILFRRTISAKPHCFHDPLRLEWNRQAAHPAFIQVAVRGIKLIRLSLGDPEPEFLVVGAEV